MKIFRFLPNNITTGATLYKDMGVATIPDTALLIQKRPFFIPDFTQQCVARLCVCARINRLGRSINERFAQRYYNANEMCLGVHFIAQDLLKELQCNNKPWDLAIGFDNAVAVAEGKQTMPMSDSLKACLLYTSDAAERHEPHHHVQSQSIVQRIRSSDSSNQPTLHHETGRFVTHAAEHRTGRSAHRRPRQPLAERPATTCVQHQIK